MKFLLLAVTLACAAEAAAQAQFTQQRSESMLPAPSLLLGTWGTEAQCALLAAGGSDNPGRMPYQISDDWIRQGFLYCHLAWRGQESVGDEIRYYADAECGEDDLRDYRLMLELRDRRLRIRWSKDFSTAALEAC